MVLFGIYELRRSEPTGPAGRQLSAHTLGGTKFRSPLSEDIHPNSTTTDHVIVEEFDAISRGRQKPGLRKFSKP